MKKIGLSLALLCIILASAYTIAWYYFAGVIEREVAAFVSIQETQNITFDGTFSPVHGFPGVFKLIYTGMIKTPDVLIKLPEMQISGIPLEGQEITLIAPLGIVIDTNALPPHLQKLEQAAMTFVVPTEFPQTLSYPYLKVWQSNGNAKLTIPSLTLQWQDASIFAESELRLDEDLQWEGEATLGVTNHNFFVTLLAEEIGISESQKIMLISFLNMLNNANGAVVLPFRIQDNALYINMIRLGPAPLMMWPGTPFSGRGQRGNRLDLPQ